MVHPDNTYLKQECAYLMSPFGAAEQKSWWRNKAPNLSEPHRFFGVPKPAGQPSSI